MDIPEILEALKYYNGTFPKDAVEAAVKEKERIIPELLGILENAVANIRAIKEEEGEFVDYMAHEYAMYLLSQFGEKRAFPLIVRFFTALENDDYRFTGDIITEDLPRILASTFDGNEKMLIGMIRNPRLDEFIRTAAARAPVILYFYGDIKKEGLVDIFRSLLADEDVIKDAYVVTDIIYLASKTYLSELLGVIKSLYSDGAADEYEWSLSDLGKDFSRPEARTTAYLRNDFHYTKITDTVAAIEWWYCFHKEGEPEEGMPFSEKESGIEAPGAWPGRNEPYQRTSPKTGRNDPCPCGSGKKYKKCCGA